MKKTQTILIIDDNPTNLGVLTENLKSWSFDCMIARNGESGLQKAIKGKPDFILLDIYMPGMNGFEVCEKLKKEPSTSEIPVIFLTADSDQTDKLKGFQMGAVDYITKPFQPEEVLARINRHLELHILRKQLQDQNEQIKLKNVQLENEILERKNAEAKQRELETINLRLQKAESLSQMAGGIAHLFNNYLYAVSGHLELALEELHDSELFIRENIIKAMKAVNLASDVSGSMLTYLGQKIVKPELIDISESSQKSISIFSPFANKNIKIESNFIDKQLIVKANASQMQQVLNHLITNAYESIVENDGKINITTKALSASEIESEFKTLRLFPYGYKLSSELYGCIEVSDTGYGIPEDEIEKIFDPFFTTKFIGRGLGLAVVLGVIKSWAGVVGIKSKSGYGSSFMVFLPLSLDKIIPKLKKQIQSFQIVSNPTILLVEDHEMVRNITISVLKRMGCEVISASNGIYAIELFKEHKDSINCIITDLSMPGIDGWTTLSKIRKINPNIPAILASGYDEAFAMSLDDSERPQAFLHKPYSMKDLEIALEKALNSLHCSRELGTQKVLL